MFTSICQLFIVLKAIEIVSESRLSRLLILCLPVIAAAPYEMNILHSTIQPDALSSDVNYFKDAQ